MNLQDIGWNQCAYAQTPDHSHGRVACATRERFLVWTQGGEIEATISGHLRHAKTDQPCTGDWVVLREDSVITSVLPRRSKLVRKQPGKEVREQILAANIDVLFIVIGLDHDYSPSRLERYLILAYESGARPVIVLNKSDLCTDFSTVVDGTRRHAPGVPIAAVSALHQRDTEVIPQYVKPGETAALIGSSGAGKSSIVNCLLGEQRQRTTDVRDADSKGRHTTTRRELIRMPQGWLLMDLPGLRELQLWADPEQLDQAFSDIAELAQACRFRDCTHTGEPGCAVCDADIAPQRLASYHKLQRELNYLEKLTDHHAARDFRNKTKTIERDIRHHPKRNW